MPRRSSPFAAVRCVTSLLAVAVLAGMVACAAAPATSPVLYQRLGGTAVMGPVVDRTINRAASDERTRRSFADIKLKTLRDSIVQQICSVAGGGCKYEGETMASSHHDARIQASEFDALVSMLREEMDRGGVDPAAKNELLRILAPMKRDIVTPQPLARSAP